MDVSVRHAGTGQSCVIGVPEGGTVVELKADALDEMFAGSVNTTREAAGLAVHIEGCEEELDDSHRVADTGLEDGGAVKLVPRWPNVKAPAVYSAAHGKVPSSIALSRCGKLCVVGHAEGQVTVFDTVTANVVADLTHGNMSIRCTPLSVCGTRLATCSRDGTACVWLVATWEQVCTLPHNNRVWGAAWTYCGRLVSGDNSGKLRVWEVKDTPSATVLEGHSEAVPGIAVSRTRIFSGSEDKSIRVWDISTLTHTHTLDDHSEQVVGLALTKDEQQLVSCSDDESFKVWCTATLQCLRTVQLENYPTSLAVSQPGDVVAVKDVRHTHLYRLSTGERVGKVHSRGFDVALSPCGRWFFTPTKFISVAVCDMSSV